MKLIKDLGTINNRRFGIYQCSQCLTEKKKRTDSAKRNKTTLCVSCLTKQYKTTHGLSTSRVYQCWEDMKSRCFNENNPSYKDYGGRGIKVCSAWLSFQEFSAWAYSNGYSKHLSIDRINNDDNYYPMNCRWATCATQARNTRKLRSSNTTGFRGVCRDKRRGTYYSRIMVDKENIFLGTFKTALEAAKAYDKYVINNNLEHTINGVIIYPCSL